MDSSVEVPQRLETNMGMQVFLWYTDSIPLDMYVTKSAVAVYGSTVFNSWNMGLA